MNVERILAWKEPTCKPTGRSALALALAVTLAVTLALTLALLADAEDVFDGGQETPGRLLPACTRRKSKRQQTRKRGFIIHPSGQWELESAISVRRHLVKVVQSRCIIMVLKRWSERENTFLPNSSNNVVETSWFGGQ